MEAGVVQILEGALLAAGEPLSVQRMILLFEEDERPAKEDIRAAIKLVEERWWKTQIAVSSVGLCRSG